MNADQHIRLMRGLVLELSKEALALYSIGWPLDMPRNNLMSDFEDKHHEIAKRVAEITELLDQIEDIQDEMRMMRETT